MGRELSLVARLAQRPEDRYQTASSLVAALQEALSARDEPDVAPPLASEALPHETPTLPAIPLVPAHLVARVQGAIAGAQRNPRVLVMTLMTLLVVAAFGGAALAGGLVLMRGARTIFMPRPVVTATAPPGRTATSTLVLLKQDKRTCSATQTITNQTGEAVRWSWDPPAVDGHTFQVNRGPQVSWPSNRNPGIAPGGADALQVRSDCKRQSITVHLTDTLGQRYAFALTVQ